MTMATDPLLPAPEWQTSVWLNTPQPLSLAALRGRVVLLHAFQMLCPGCVSHALPQAQRVAASFADAPLVVIGLHTVFEHHAVMGPDALRAFVHEYRIRYPVAVDAPGPNGDPLPLTMRAYDMQGTPTLVLIDALGRLRHQAFGAVDDLALGALIGQLLAEAQRVDAEPTGAAVGDLPGCDDERCRPAAG